VSPKRGPALRLAQPFRLFVQRFAFLSLVLASFGLMVFGKADPDTVARLRTTVTDAVAPILDALSRPTGAISNATTTLQEMADLRAENQRLRDENARLLEWQTAARHLQSQNESLRSLLNFVPIPPPSHITARVIADPGGPFAQSVLLNVGERDGVTKGQAVISGEGLVGRVAMVGNRSTRVLLLTDINSRIPAVIESSRARGILTGDNGDQARLLFLPVNAAIAPGERVVTSGHGGVFPPGLPIGVVSSVADGVVRVQPFLRRHRLEYARVVDYGLKGILRDDGLDQAGGGDDGDKE
jgi:rod shape-determining protein MreC